MITYFKYLNPVVRNYFSILCEQFPDFLYDYIDTPEMKRLSGIGLNCGTDYTRLFKNKFFYSRLDHSIGTALIIWHFTQDRKQTLAGLFHDIATPAFSHCVDYLYGDYMKQEFTENLTADLIRNSSRIMKLLERDGLSAEDVHDYKCYPIADNEAPKLSADRLEYTLVSGMIMTDSWNLQDIENIYDNLIVITNEDGIEEIAFSSQTIAESFVKGASRLWYTYISNPDKLTMQFIADVLKYLIHNGRLNERQLYTLSEQQIIEIIESSGDYQIAHTFIRFRNSQQIIESHYLIPARYCISLEVKRRYIIPLVSSNNQALRLTDLSSETDMLIRKYLNFHTYKYASFDFSADLLTAS